MKKFFLVIFMFLFVLCGCSSKKVNKQVSKRDINCYADGSSFTLMLEDGQIVKYIDSVDGDLGQEVVDILNEEHLMGVTDNDVAFDIMNVALSDLGGYCK